MSDVLIYGATGYTGRLACEYAKQIGIDFAIGGRTESAVRDLASSLQVPSYTFALTDQTCVDAALHGRKVLLNCAGPFTQTAEPLIEACIRNGTHYLDVAADIDSYHLAEQLGVRAREAGVMLMPGCGGSVAILGCLTDYALKTVQGACSIDIALHISGSLSRGSAMSASGSITKECLQRSGGRLVLQDSTSTRCFDFGDGRGAVSSFPATLPDLLTLWKSTGVENIRTYVNFSDDAFPTDNLDLLPTGPTAEQREANPFHVAIEVVDSNGMSHRTLLHTVNGYTFTSQGSIEAVKLVLEGRSIGGFQTPGGLFGHEFVQKVPGSLFKTI